MAEPGPCLYPNTERCGKFWAYTSLRCRGVECRRAARDRKRAHRGTAIADSRDITEGRPTDLHGLRVIDANANHPARARWAALIAKLDSEV